VQLLRAGFRVEALRAGTDLVRIRTADGRVETHAFIVSSGPRPGVLRGAK
jgi:hypothetical protein